MPADHIATLLVRYDSSPLECDRLTTRVCRTVLTGEEQAHTVYFVVSSEIPAAWKFYLEH